MREEILIFLQILLTGPSQCHTITSSHCQVLELHETSQRPWIKTISLPFIAGPEWKQQGLVGPGGQCLGPADAKVSGVSADGCLWGDSQALAPG